LRSVEQAYRACRRRKRATVRACLYEQRLLDHLVETRDALREQRWRPRPPVVFAVERPKAREIYAAQFEDRVVHHWLVPQLEAVMDRDFIHDSASNRTGRGTHFAVDRLQTFMRRLNAPRNDGTCHCERSEAISRPTPKGIASPSARNDRSGMRDDRSGMRDDRSGMRDDRSGMRDDGSGMRDDRSGMRGDGSGMQGDGSGTQGDGSGMRGEGWFLQLDIANFFNSIHQPTLLELLGNKLQKAVRRRGMPLEQARLCYRIASRIVRQPCAEQGIRLCTPGEYRQVPAHKRLENAPPDTGLPIGNLTSQFFANLYLNELDQFVKHELKCRHYVRYVDDFVLLHEDRAQLVRWHTAIAAFLEQRLRLTLKPHPVLAPLRNGADFLGYIVKPGYRLVRRRVVGNLHEKLAAYERTLLRRTEDGLGVDLPPRSRDALRSTLASYWGHFKRADSYRLKQKIFRRFPWLALLFSLPAEKQIASPAARNDVGPSIIASRSGEESKQAGIVIASRSSEESKQAGIVIASRSGEESKQAGIVIANRSCEESKQAGIVIANRSCEEPKHAAPEAVIASAAKQSHNVRRHDAPNKEVTYAGANLLRLHPDQPLQSRPLHRRHQQSGTPPVRASQRPDAGVCQQISLPQTGLVRNDAERRDGNRAREADQRRFAGKEGRIDRGAESAMGRPVVGVAGRGASTYLKGEIASPAARNDMSCPLRTQRMSSRAQRMSSRAQRMSSRAQRMSSRTQRMSSRAQRMSLRAQRSNLCGAGDLVPRWEPPAVASMATQWRWFAHDWPGFVLLMQCGRQLLASEPLPGAAHYTGAARIDAWALPMGRLSAIERRLQRLGRSYLYCDEQGYLRGGLKRRALRRLWLSRATPAPSPVGARPSATASCVALPPASMQSSGRFFGPRERQRHRPECWAPKSRPHATISTSN